MIFGYLDDVMLIWFFGVFKFCKSLFINIYKFYIKLFVFLYDVYVKMCCLFFLKGEYFLVFYNILYYVYNVFKVNVLWFNFMFFKYLNKEYVFLKENLNNLEDEYVYFILK